MSPSSKLDALKSDIIAILSSCGENKSLKRKKITSKCVKESKLKDLDKGEVKKALKELVKSGRVKNLVRTATAADTLYSRMRKNLSLAVALVTPVHPVKTIPVHPVKAIHRTKMSPYHLQK